MTGKKKKPNKEEEYLNNWKRAQADLENYQKEVSKRMEDFARFANQEVIGEMIEVMDNLEMALQYAKGDIQKGLEQVIKRFNETLEKYNVKKIVVNVGDKFDPALHEAVEGTGEIVDKLVREGYKIYDKVLRPSRVKVK